MGELVNRKLTTAAASAGGGGDHRPERRAPLAHVRLSAPRPAPVRPAIVAKAAFSASECTERRFRYTRFSGTAPWITTDRSRIRAMRRGRWAERPRGAAAHGTRRRDPRGGARRSRRAGADRRPACQDGGPWRRLLPGIVLLGSGPATRQQEITAALMYGGPDALVTGLEACRRHGVRRGSAIRRGRSTCSCPTSGSSRASEFVVVERTTRLPPATPARRRAAGPRVRACLDAARRLHSAAEITELIADTVQRRLCTPAQLAAELREGSQRGSATPRRVLADVSEGVSRRPSATPSVLLARSGLPAPWWNVAVYDDQRPAARDRGRLVRRGRARLGDQLLRLAPEPRVYAREVTRTAGLTAADVIVLPGAADVAAPRPGGVDGDARRRLRGGGTATAPPGRAIRTVADRSPM